MCLWYLLCKPCTYPVSKLALSPNGPNRAPPDPRHLGVPSGAYKMIYEPIVRLTQIEHLSWTDTNTVSKLIETRFHLSHVTKDSHRVRPKRFLCLWYVRCKPCTCLALTLTLTPNGLKRHSTRPMSLTSPSGASQTICDPMVHSVQTVQLSYVKISTISKRTEQSSTRPTSLRSTIGCV
jgi:hypothetical protein